MRLALTFYSVLKMPVADIIECSVAAERAGFEYISFAESFYRDAAVLAAAVATKTRKVKFGSSIYPIATRTPFQIAMATATLNELSNGREGFIGLGVGYKERIERHFGAKIENSFAKMREHTEIIRGLLSGRDFTYRGRFFNFQDFPHLTLEPLKVPILFGSSAPRMLRLAGEIADGVVLNSIGTEQYYGYAKSMLSEGAGLAKRDPKSLEIAASIIFSVADNRDEAIEAARPDVLFYLLYPELDPVIEKTPYVEQVAEIRRVHSRGDSRKALSLVRDDIVDNLSISGTPKECRAKLRKLTDYGVTLPVIRVSVQPFKEDQRKNAFLKTIDALSSL